MAVLTPMSRPALSSSGPPEFPGVDGGVGLDHIADGNPGHGIDFATEGGDDPGGEGLVETEGVADGEYALADQKIPGFADPQRSEFLARRIDPEHREVLLRGHPDHSRRPTRLIGEGDLCSIAIRG